MTRKDYVRLAAALRGAKPFDFGPGTSKAKLAAALVGWQLAVNAVAHTLNAENPRFDYDKFFAACGILT